MKSTHAHLCAIQTWGEGECWENTVHTPPASVREMGGGLIRRHLNCVSTRDMVCTLDQFVAKQHLPKV